MAEIVYLLCAAMSIGCAVMLFRGHLKSPSQLLFWSAACFGFLALNNVILVVDLIILPDVNFDGVWWRNLMGATAGSVLLFGLIWELT